MLKISEDLAEFFGIMFGDGKIYCHPIHGYAIRIWCNYHNEKDYAEYISQIIERLFFIKPKKYESPKKGSICIQFHSKNIAYGLLELGIPKNHKGKMPIPHWIMSNNSNCKAFLRGLFDTDGCVINQRFDGYTYKLIKITMKNKKFALDVKTIFEKVGLHPYMCSQVDHNEVVIRKKKDLELWKTKIGSNSFKNLLKLEKRPLAAVH